MKDDGSKLWSVDDDIPLKELSTVVEEKEESAFKVSLNWCVVELLYGCWKGFLMPKYPEFSGLQALKCGRWKGLVEMGATGLPKKA